MYSEVHTPQLPASIILPLTKEHSLFPWFEHIFNPAELAEHKTKSRRAALV